MQKRRLAAEKESWEEFENVLEIKETMQRNQACVSQKTRKLYGPEKFSGRFSGVIFGLRKVFLKTPERNPRFSGMFFRECPSVSA